MTRIRRLAFPTALVAALIAGSSCAAFNERVASVDPSTGASAPAAAPTTMTTSAAPSPSSTPKAGTSPKPSAQPTTAKPTYVLEKGDKGEKVRELQHRLRQLDWYSGSISGTYATSTVKGVKGFQDKRKIGKTGAVDTKTWTVLTKMTRKPSKAEMHNKLVPGPAIMKQGSSGDRVRDLQARLRQIAWYSGNVTGTYGSVTTTAVKGFQAKREIPVTGAVDQRTLDRLRAMTSTPTSDAKHNRAPKPSAAGLDSRCLSGRAMCISKRTNSLVWVVNGHAKLRVDVRFGSQELPTREGSFSVGWKSRNHVSTIYHTRMPYAMFFSGGQAVHYSPDFAARGYNGASHGCVNVRNLSGIQWLFNQVRVGDKVIVYR
jgi:peptidoglycan hydrolase-like protein with peptidoglycan-binding domain